jgi:hypothetical protein
MLASMSFVFCDGGVGTVAATSCETPGDAVERKAVSRGV